MYQGTRCFNKCGPVITPFHDIKVGVKQGCPISIILFNIAINPEMVTASMTGVSSYLFDVLLQVLASTDDLALIANNEEDLQVIIEITNDNNLFCGMSFLSGKCAYTARCISKD